MLQSVRRWRLPSSSSALPRPWLQRWRTSCLRGRRQVPCAALCRLWLLDHPLVPCAAVCCLPGQPCLCCAAKPLLHTASACVCCCAAGGEDPSDWTDGVWNALCSSELPVFKLGMYDASPDAPGLCCPGRAQRLMDAAHAALAAVPLATPEGRPEAAHAFFVATLALATCGLADWALPQWAEEEKEHGGVCSCARCGG